MTEHICITCHKAYSQKTKNKILATLPSLEIYSEDICLSCYQTIIRQNKSTLMPDLRQSKPLLDEAKAVYDNLYTEWKALTTQYQKYDYHDKIITHQQNLINQEKALKQTKLTKKKKVNKPTKNQKNAILALLKNLSKEQQDALFTKINNQ